MQVLKVTEYKQVKSMYLCLNVQEYAAAYDKLMSRDIKYTSVDDEAGLYTFENTNLSNEDISFLQREFSHHNLHLDLEYVLESCKINLTISEFEKNREVYMKSGRVSSNTSCWYVTTDNTVDTYHVLKAALTMPDDVTLAQLRQLLF